MEWLIFLISLLFAAEDPKVMPAEFNPWSGATGGIIGAATGTGFSIWIAWFLIARVLPDKEKAFAAEREAVQKRHADRFEAMEKRHADHMSAKELNYREDMREAWKVNREIADQHKAVLERLSDKIESGCRFKREG